MAPLARPLLLAAAAAAATLALGCSERSSEAPSAADAPAGGDESAVGTRPTAPAPRIHTPNPRIDFGRLMRGVTATTEFALENRGDATLVVQMIQTVCGCTVARLVLPDGSSIVPPKETVPDPNGIVSIAPGESAVLVVELATADQKLGALSKHVMVHTNDPLNGMIRLGLEATLAAPFHVAPPEATFGEVTRGDTPTLTIEVTVAELEGAEVVGVAGAPPWVEAEVRRLDRPGSYALDVRLREDAPVGYLKGEVRAKVDHPTFDGFDVPVYATVTSRLRFDTGNPANRERIDFAVLRPGVPVTAHVLVSLDEADRTFRVTGVDVESTREDLVETAVETLEEGRRYRVSVTCTADASTRIVRGTLHIRTDHADQPEKALPFQGWVDSNP